MKNILFVLLVAHGCDAVTTVAGMHRGAMELNPVLTNQPAVNVGVHAAIASSQTSVLVTLNRHHPKLARTLGLAAIAVEGFAVGSNLRVLRGR